jgi:hypothetical protein
MPQPNVNPPQPLPGGDFQLPFRELCEKPIFVSPHPLAVCRHTYFILRKKLDKNLEGWHSYRKEREAE